MGKGIGEGRRFGEGARTKGGRERGKDESEEPKKAYVLRRKGVTEVSWP